MITETDLKSFVTHYAIFDPEQRSYTSTLNQDEISCAERVFSQLLLKWLLQSGPEAERIKENYNKLIPLFEKKISNPLLPEISWIEHTFYNNADAPNEGSCLKTLSICYEKLIAPENFKSIQFNEIITREDLRKWIENFKAQSVTYTERNLYYRLLRLLDESEEYFDEVGKIKLSGIRFLISSLPVLLAGLGAVAFVEELFAVYALYFVLLKSGQFLGNQSRELQKVGHALQKFSVLTAMTTTTLLVYLVEMVFWGSRQCYGAMLQSGSRVLEPLILSNQPDLITPSDNLEQDLIQASQSSHQGISFINYQLKLITSPIEVQKGLLGQQYFLEMRVGKAKLKALELFLINIQMLDQNKEPIEAKFEIARNLIKLVKKNKLVYTPGGKTAAAIDKAESFLNFFIDNPSIMQEKNSEQTQAHTDEIGKIAERYRLFLQN